MRARRHRRRPRPRRARHPANYPAGLGGDLLASKAAVRLCQRARPQPRRVDNAQKRSAYNEMDRWRTWNAQKLPGRAVNRFVQGWIRSQPSALSGIEVHRTACIVTHPPGGEHANHGLVNPANESLCGTRFTPEECWKHLHGDPTTGRWDSELVVYPTQAIDGLVTEFGGDELRIRLEAQPADKLGHRCAVGSAIATPASSELLELYAHLIHAVAPFYRKLEPQVWEDQLQSTYHAAFDTACDLGLSTVAVPLLGAGARGAPKADAMRVAAEATVRWRAAAEDPGAAGAPLLVRFGVQDSSTAHALISALESAMQSAEAAHGARFTRHAPPSADHERWA